MLTQIDAFSRGRLAALELTFKVSTDRIPDKNMQEQFADALKFRSSDVVSQKTSNLTVVRLCKWEMKLALKQYFRFQHCNILSR